MKLKELTRIINIPPPYYEIEFNGITNDSREVVPGNLFIAIPGYKTDGSLYLTEAFKNGASAALIEGELTTLTGLPLIPVVNIRKIQGRVAALFYGQPAQKMRIIGVTGTNGKTTVTHLIKHILSASDIAVGLIGTVWNYDGQKIQITKRTTPDSIQLQQILARMVDNGIKTVVMEVSSHALFLDRVAGTEFDVAVLTNITHDHFDFHQNFEKYLAAKSLLFESLQGGLKKRKYAILNEDDPNAMKIALACPAPVFYYGLASKRGNGLVRIRRQRSHNLLTFDLNGEKCRVKTKLPGGFNVSNILAAITVCQHEGMAINQIERALLGFPGIPGRYQEVDCGQEFKVMVDFAHNPAALEHILIMAREYTKGRVILVFGCEGEKDRLKRPLMGRIAVQKADIPILTSDNLYYEDINQIIADVTENLTSADKFNLIIEPDRKEAIKKAVQLAAADDFVIVAGKGHKQYLVKGSEQIEFNDFEILKDILNVNYCCNSTRKLNSTLNRTSKIFRVLAVKPIN